MPLSGFACMGDDVEAIKTRLYGALGRLRAAFADDTAMVISDYIKTLPWLCHVFGELSTILALTLNIAKTVLIPLWPAGD